MVGDSQKPSQGRVPKALLGMIALIVVIEGFFARNALEYSDYMSYSWRFGDRAARGWAGRSDVVCFGDSMVKLGILPRVLERQTGQSAYNLAVFGGQAPSSYFLLRRVLESGGKPGAVIVDFHSNLLAAAPRSSVPYWADLVDPRDGLDLAWNTCDFGLVAKTTLAWLLPSYKGRLEIRSEVLAALRGEDRPEMEERRALRRNWRKNSGAYVIAKAHREAPPIETSPSAPGKWSPRPVNVAYLRRFFDLASAKGVAVYWLIPPTDPDWQLRRERLGVDEPFTRFVRSISERYPNVTVVDGRHAGYDRSAFLDPTHLNRRGALELSASMSELIASRRQGEVPASARWVDLEPPRGRTAVGFIEDLGESKQALRDTRTFR